MAKRKIETAAVLGSGVMGSGIAGLLAGAGIKTWLLDISPKEGNDRDAIAKNNLKAAAKAKPSPFYSMDDQRLIVPGNFDDDLGKLGECDWVIEVIVENLEIKQSLMEKVAGNVGENTIVSTNTSGIDVDAIVEKLPAGFRKRWLGTHFFNPPRYMKLLELIPGKDTDPQILDFVAEFGRDVLGKGIIYAKNTPNFIANRIGTYGMMATVQQMLEDGLSIPEVDAVLGQPLGRPKTAIFKTCDLVGIDTMVHVASNIHPVIPDDPHRDAFLVPEFVKQLVADGKLGNKTKAGFYTKKGKDRFVLDVQSGEYVPLERPEVDVVKAVKGIEKTTERVHKLIMEGDDKYAEFAWKTTAFTLSYSALLIPEISDTIVEIDHGMKWGYNWQLGPFETWDALGVADAVKRMEQDGIDVPDNVRKMLDSGATRFYEDRADGRYFYDLVNGGYKKIEADTKQVLILALKTADGGIVEQTPGATVVDAGDGVLLVEFHTKMNAVDESIITALSKAQDRAEAEGWNGIVIGNHSDTFSAGANLMLVMMLANQQKWDDLAEMVDQFQQANMRLKYGPVPVVAAVGGLALGGGCEIPMHCDKVVVAGEAYMGLVEVGVGLIPAAGGTKELVCKLQAGIPHGITVPPLPLAEKAFTAIATAQVGTSGKQAIENGHLLPWTTRVELNRDHIIHHAKQDVLALATAGYRPPQRKPVKLAGGGAYGALLVGVDGFHKSGMASDYDLEIGKKLAKVITGGDVPEGYEVDEQHLLDLEREVFLSLCGEDKTKARIQHMLMNNKPLRN